MLERKLPYLFLSLPHVFPQVQESLNLISERCVQREGVKAVKASKIFTGKPGLTKTGECLNFKVTMVKGPVDYDNNKQ